MSVHTRAGAASTTPLIEDVRKMVWLQRKAHETYHKRPSSPRQLCELCRQTDRVEGRLTSMGLPSGPPFGTGR